ITPKLRRGINTAQWRDGISNKRLSCSANYSSRFADLPKRTPRDTAVTTVHPMTPSAIEAARKPATALTRAGEEDMPRSCTSLTLDDATRMLHAGEAAAARFGVACNIAVVDAGGNLVAFARQDGALIGSIELAIGKAVTARIFDKPTSLLAELAQPGAPLFGIQETNSGQVVIFGGGVPVRSDVVIVGGGGVSRRSAAADY